MSRVELLFGSRPPARRVAVSRHPRPDPTLPLRMQAMGRCAPRQRRLCFRISQWKCALTSPAIAARTGLLTLCASPLLLAARLQTEQIVIIFAAAALFAQIAGAWTKVAMEDAGSRQSQN